jgi:hypothetical protein
VTLSTRVLVVAWCVIGIVLWSALFDWWMHGAAREYLIQAATHELGRGPEPVLADLMAEARRGGIARATLWSGLVTAAGLATLRFVKK